MRRKRADLGQITQGGSGINSDSESALFKEQRHAEELGKGKGSLAEGGTIRGSRG